MDSGRRRMGKPKVANARTYAEQVTDFHAKFHEVTRKFAQIRAVVTRCYAFSRVGAFLDANYANERELGQDIEQEAPERAEGSANHKPRETEELFRQERGNGRKYSRTTNGEENGKIEPHESALPFEGEQLCFP